MATVLALLLAGCGGGDNVNPITPGNFLQEVTSPSMSVADTFAYQPDSPVAANLRRCTYAGHATRECTLAELPFLGQDTNDPTRDDIAKRLLVSHTWMGDNFLELLDTMPNEMRALFRSITSIVIASDINPAFYRPRTGAIYLDPTYVWLTTAQAADINAPPDPRLGFGLDLQFVMPWRYTRAGQRLSVSVNAQGLRDVGETSTLLAFLLFHELAHAGDFMPPAELAGIDTDDTVLQAIDRISDRWLSTGMTDAFPLNSAALTDAARVSFFGDDASAADLALSPADVASEFTLDGASQYYSYSTQFEDFANLFDTIMMAHHYGYTKEVGITSRAESGAWNDGVVEWAAQDWFANQSVRPRALAVVNALYPGDVAAVEALINASEANTIDGDGVTTWAEAFNTGTPSGTGARSISSTPLRRDDVLASNPVH
ncbi:MAG: hypothetical protein AAF515_01885 [Pseudomonadota bacterium]